MYGVDLNGKPHDLKAVGRRVEERRAALGVSLDDLCAAAGLSGTGTYWRKVTCKKSEHFTPEELKKVAAFLAAPEGWPFQFKPDPERIAAFVMVRQAAADAKRKSDREVKSAARRLVPQIPACTHERPISWCGPCVAEALVVAELDALRRCVTTLEALLKQQEQAAGEAAAGDPLPRARMKQAKAALQAIRGVYEGAAARHGVVVSAEGQDSSVAVPAHGDDGAAKRGEPEARPRSSRAVGRET